MADRIEEVRRRLDAAEDVTPGDLPGDDGGPSRDGWVPDDGPGGDRDGDWGEAPPEPPFDLPAEDDPRAAEGARLPLNDTGNGRRFALYFGDAALTVPRVGWHVWDGRRWRLDPDGIQVRGLAQRVQEHIVREIPHLALEDWQLRELAQEASVRARKAALDAIDEKDRTAEQQVEAEDLAQRLIWIRKLKDRKSGMKSDHRSFAKTSGNKGRIDAILTEATVALSREVEWLDSDPLTVNTETGLLRFSVTGGLDDDGCSRTADVRREDHAREVAVPGQNAPQIITRLMPVAYDPAARCPRFDAFLARVQPDPEMRGFLQRWLGLSMSGLKVQKFAFLYGSGANGKSVLIDLIARLLGDYSHSAKIESFTGRNRRGGGDATPDIFPLMGARMVRASEPEEGERLQEGLIKELTGGEPILVRKLHDDFIEVHPFFKLTMSGNHKPDIRGTDDGIWRRVLLVPFDVQIPESERDQALGEKLWAERSGILNWLVAGLIDYLEGGLQEPAQVLAATEEYRAESDPIGMFLAEACEVTGDPADWLSGRDLGDGFNLWQDLRGEGMWTPRTTSLKLKDKSRRYRAPETGKTFAPVKRDVTGYGGIRFAARFEVQFRDAPRNAQNRPFARSSASGGSGEDFPT